MKSEDYINHYNGDVVREQWPIGMEVTFRPKSFMGGKPLKGVIIGHIYTNVLIIESNEAKWWISTFRCDPPIFKI